MKKVKLYYEKPYPIVSLVHLFKNLEEYVKVHPLLLNAQKVNLAESKYKITERPFKYLPFKFKYLASVHSNDDSIEYVIAKIPFTKLNIKYDLVKIDHNHTKIKCMIELDFKLIGQSIFIYKLKKAQNELMQALDKYFSK